MLPCVYLTKRSGVRMKSNKQSSMFKAIILISRNQESQN